MVRGTVYRVLGLEQPAEGLRQVFRSVKNCEVEEPGRVPGGGGRVPAHPGVQADVVVVAAGREEHRVIPYHCVISNPSMSL